jgi:hypothetical protein
MACYKPLRESASRNEWFFVDKLRYDLSNVTARSATLEVVTKQKVSIFEEPSPTLDHGETNINVSKDSTKFPIYRFRSFLVQQEEFHHASFLMILNFDPLNVHFDFLMRRSVGNSSVAIKQRTEIQI